MPVNPFGNVAPSNARKELYQSGRQSRRQQRNGSENVSCSRSRSYTTLSAAAFSMSGVLPWQLPAGEIGVAFGAEWRLHRDGQKDIDAWAQVGLYTVGQLRPGV